jgi:hypothetical protein
VFVVLFFLLTGCAVLKSLPFSEESKKYQEAETFFEQGQYKDAYGAYRAISATDSPWAEQAKFNAAYVLVYHKNPDKDYALVAREFDEFLARYPSGARAGEAHTWLGILKMFDQTKTGELLKETAALTARIEAATKELQKAQGNEEVLKKERDALLAEKTGLAKKVDDLLNEKEALIKNNTALVKDNEALTKDRAALEKKIVALNKEKNSLIQAKLKLEKSIRDLTLVDIKMEKKRKKMQKEEKK